MKHPLNAGLAVGIVSMATLLSSCDGGHKSSEAVSAEPPAVAARVAIPDNLGSLTPLNLSTHPTITYYLDGYYASVATWQTSAVEAFREWTAAITDDSRRTRFVRTYDPELAHIRVIYSTGASKGGCTESNGVRFCDLKVGGPTTLPKAIGLALGVRASNTPGEIGRASCRERV